MLHRVEKRIENLEKSRLLAEYFGDAKVGFLDIETTGLSPKTCKVILGGLVVVESLEQSDNGSGEADEMLSAELTCHEFFSDFGSKDDEKALLAAYLEEIRKLDVIVTYNGEHFDVPFLFERCEKHRLECREGFPFNFDLYRLLKTSSDLRELLPNLKQKTVERYYGLWPTRTDEISGEDSVNLYYAYLSHKPGPGKDAIRETIILHNSDDCMQLCRLAPIVKKLDLYKGMWQTGFPFANLPVKKIELKGDKLIVSGVQRKNAIDFKSFDTPGRPYEIRMDKRFRSYEAVLPLKSVNPGHEMDTLKLLDLETFSFDTDSIKGLPQCENQYIIVAEGEKVAYKTVIAFVKLLLSAVELQTK